MEANDERRANGACGTDGDRAGIEARRLTYGLLSRLFLEEVPADLLAQMRDDPPFAEGEGELGRYMAGLAGADLEQARTDAVAEFASLLLNMSADPVFPYESVYTSPERLMMQQARDEVLAAYRAAGLAQTGAVKVPEDHAAIELEFMAKLCERERAALDGGDDAAREEAREAQRAFLHDHLLAWMPQLCDDLEKRAHTGLYRGLAETTRQFLAFEKDELG